MSETSNVKRGADSQQRRVRRCVRCGAQYGGRSAPDVCIRYMMTSGSFCGGKIK
jgi:hypothetical protein